MTGEYAWAAYKICTGGNHRDWTTNEVSDEERHKFLYWPRHTYVGANRTNDHTPRNTSDNRDVTLPPYSDKTEECRTRASEIHLTFIRSPFQVRK